MINRVRAQQCEINGEWGLTGINYGLSPTKEHCWEQISRESSCNKNFFIWSPIREGCYCFMDLTATHHSCTEYVENMYGYETFEVLDIGNHKKGISSSFKTSEKALGC